jgi:archaetidylinositol phosphate synthase
MNEASVYRPAVRLHDSVLAAAEKRLLVRIAARIPGSINSDHLTAVGALAMFGVGACFWAGRAFPIALIGVVPFLALNWFGDSLDGTLARVRRHERPRYGYYVDHVLDAIGFAALVCGLILGGYMSPTIGLAFLSAYYALVVEVALAAHARCTFRMAFWHIGPTELRILLAAGSLMALRSPTVTLFGSPWLLFDLGGLAGTVGLSLTFLLSAIQNGRALYCEEKLQTRN